MKKVVFTETFQEIEQWIRHHAFAYMVCPVGTCILNVRWNVFRNSRWKVCLAVEKRGVFDLAHISPEALHCHQTGLCKQGMLLFKLYNILWNGAPFWIRNKV
jgi:hypothetical protein